MVSVNSWQIGIWTAPCATWYCCWQHVSHAIRPALRQGRRPRGLANVSTFLPCQTSTSEELLPSVNGTTLSKFCDGASSRAEMDAHRYNTYIAHYKEAECFRLAIEHLLYDAGVDMIFAGENCNIIV